MQNWCIAGCLRSGKSEVTELCNFKNAMAKSEVAALCKFTVGARFGAVFGACFWRLLGVAFWSVFGLVFWRPGRAGRGSRALAFLALVLGAWAARVRRWRAVCFVPVAGVPVLLFSMARGAVRRGCAAWRRRSAGVCAVAARDFVCCGGGPGALRARAPGVRVSSARCAGVALAACLRSSFSFSRLRSDGDAVGSVLSLRVLICHSLVAFVRRCVLCVSCFSFFKVLTLFLFLVAKFFPLGPRHAPGACLVARGAPSKFKGRALEKSKRVNLRAETQFLNLQTRCGCAPRLLISSRALFLGLPGRRAPLKNRRTIFYWPRRGRASFAP